METSAFFQGHSEEVASFVIFALGIGVGSIGAWWQRRDEVRKLNKIIWHELSYNFELLSMEKEKIELNETAQTHRHSFLAHISKSLSTAVFDSYLSKLDLLKEKQIDTLLAHYMLLKQIVNHGREFSEYLNIAERSEIESNKLAARAAAIELQIAALTARNQETLRKFS